jgi:hypothetical protein
MDLKSLTESQRRALLDLAVLAMYSDAHLAAAEDDRIDELLIALGVAEGSDRTREYDAAVGRIRHAAQSRAAAQAHAATLARQFTHPAQRKDAYAWIEGLVSSDGQVAPPENSYLTVVREALQL